MTAPESPAPRRRRWPGIVALVVAVPALLLIAYTALSLNWAYSEGERVGVVQKISRKGWLCKTWEGELYMAFEPGGVPRIWNFTVRDERVLPLINGTLGKEVSLHYTEHKGIPTSCFGDTPYFVDSLTLREVPKM